MGHRLKCIIVKHHTCDHDKEHEDEEDVVESRIATPHGEHKVKFDLPYEQTANALMSAKGYSEYVKKHGYHFTDALAEHVSKMMENANGQSHSWTAAQVKKSMESLGLTIPSHVTHGDAAFCRWTADAIGKAIKLDWEKFV
jgi:predicted ThiF/HesA family dinucleotide-utilizing enzyme